MEISKQDWKLYCERVPLWQEAYMERLNQEYMAILCGEAKPSDKFWALHDRIVCDGKSAGVQINMKRSTMIYELIRLVADEVIVFEQLEGFSDEVLGAVRNMAKCLRMKRSTPRAGVLSAFFYVSSGALSKETYRYNR